MLFAYLNNNKQKGYTLVELLIYVAISSVVIGSISSYFFNMMKTYNIAKDQVLISSNAAILFEKLHYDLRYGDYIDDGSSFFNSDESRLVVIKSGIPYSYFLDNGRVLKSVDGGESIAITSGDVKVDFLRIEKIDTVNHKEGVNVSIKISGNNSGNLEHSRILMGDIFVRERVIQY